MKIIKAILIILLVSMAVQANAADYAVIVNPGNGVDTISQQDIKNIYLGKKSRWGDQTEINVWAQKKNSLTDAFISAVVNRTPEQYFIYWRKKIFTGKGSPPVELVNDAQVKKAVAADPKAIGYVSRASLDSSVKQLKIQ